MVNGSYSPGRNHVGQSAAWANSCAVADYWRLRYHRHLCFTKWKSDCRVFLSVKQRSHLVLSCLVMLQTSGDSETTVKRLELETLSKIDTLSKESALVSKDVSPFPGLRIPYCTPYLESRSHLLLVSWHTPPKESALASLLPFSYCPSAPVPASLPLAITILFLSFFFFPMFFRSLRCSSRRSHQ